MLTSPSPSYNSWLAWLLSADELAQVQQRIASGNTPTFEPARLIPLIGGIVARPRARVNSQGVMAVSRFPRSERAVGPEQDRPA